MRLINADALMEDLRIREDCDVGPRYENGCKGHLQWLCRKIKNSPAIDAVPVVRCKDCKWWGLSEYNTFGIHICKKFRGVRGESDYCSRTERSEE